MIKKNSNMSNLILMCAVFSFFTLLISCVLVASIFSVKENKEIFSLEAEPITEEKEYKKLSELKLRSFSEVSYKSQAKDWIARLKNLPTYHGDMEFSMSVLGTYGEDPEMQQATLFLQGEAEQIQNPSVYFQSADVEISVFGVTYTDHLELYREDAEEECLYIFQQNHWEKVKEAEIPLAFQVTERMEEELLESGYVKKDLEYTKLCGKLSLETFSAYVGIESFLFALVNLNEFTEKIPVEFVFDRSENLIQVRTAEIPSICNQEYIISRLYYCSTISAKTKHSGIPEEVKIMAAQEVEIANFYNEDGEFPSDTGEEVPESERIYTELFGALPSICPTGEEFLNLSDAEFDNSEIADIASYIVYHESRESFKKWYTGQMWEYNTDQVKQAIALLTYLGVFDKEYLFNLVPEQELKEMLIQYEKKER